MKEDAVPDHRGKKIKDLVDPKNHPRCAVCGLPIDTTKGANIVIHWNGLFVDKYYHPVCSEIEDAAEK